ncbi:MAG TPA: TIGR02281 family clan AA aspartic protease [Roseiarcus sp.]|nr:TIGR02281 family clan AA aspartic protease [Roseiarcus sp.]
MRHLVPIGVLVGAGVALLVIPADQPILGLDHSSFTRAAIGAAIVVWFVLLAGGRRVKANDFLRAIGGALTWAALIVGLTGVYAYRYEFGDVANRVLAELSPGDYMVGQGGEVIVPRRLGGEFIVAAKVNNVPTSFLFDTGASTVVLRAEDAKTMGVNFSGLDYDVGVTTANGSALAADTVLDQLSVGPITLRNVHALIARPGALNENLLGMSFLDRLQSYSVERGRLVLKGR